MNDDFTQRLTALNAKANAAHDQAEAAKALQTEEWQQKIARVREAIDYWNVNIEPVIIDAVATANQLITVKGFHLTAKQDVVRTTSSGGRTPPIPNLPQMLIRAGVRQPGLSPVIHGRENTPAKQPPAPTHVRIAVSSDGRIEITRSVGDIPVPLEISEASEEKIELIIGDFVEGLIPGQQ